MAITKTEIQSATVARGQDKVTHETYYVVKSDSSETTWYTVRWNDAAHEWQCNCPATKPCKHERAVNEVLRIRRQRIAAAMGPETVAVMTRMQADEDRRLAEQAARREAYCQEFSIYE
jgi:hypothetical protein